MQFIPNGPDIPDALLRAHEEGRVVFFCGAGVSYPAGLPGFKGLVQKIYKLVGTALSPIEKQVFDREQYDATLDLLERRLPGQRIAVRRALADSLKPNLRLKGATDTHAALLRLARSREGALRLVTTNFDRVFDTAARRTKQPFQSYSAPMLPIPKNSRWNGLVYLHGLLPSKGDDTGLNRLVITSGDFGLAYLTERWAARFVSELFRNYVVCFVGYSINDPVLRYMMDALAADRMLGEASPQAWAFGDSESECEHRKTIEWQAKGVTPILYDVPKGTYDHSALHKTLHVWAETYRDGVMGKERMVVSHALARPSASTRQDDFVGRMIWALSDSSGLPARRFAEFDPVPPLDWLLDAFTEDRYLHGDLPRFGVPPLAEVDSKLRFSLMCRPSPYSLAPKMLLASGGDMAPDFDDVMLHLAMWLLRHLNDSRLVIWIAQRGGRLHPRWARIIDYKLNEIAQLEDDGNTSKLAEICSHAPNAVPDEPMRTLWRLVLSGRLKQWAEADVFSWKRRLARYGLTATARLEFRELLAPRLRLNKPIRWGEDVEEHIPRSLRQLVDWELVLAADHARETLRESADSKWAAALPELLGDLQQLLRDALDILRELGQADSQSDRSHWDMPSVSPHWQNRGFREWTTLIELLRDSWLSVRNLDRCRASRVAAAWFDIPYPAFKRLALFAASQDDCIKPGQWVDWLLADDAWWLWSLETQRETCRLLVLQGRHLEPSTQKRLVAAILSGPPREMYRSGLEEGRWERIVESSVWLALSKLKESGVVLDPAAAARLDEMLHADPHRQHATDERDEFSHWMTGTGDPGFNARQTIEIAPRNRHELIEWLRQPLPEPAYSHSDTWRDVCRTRIFHSLYALRDLANSGVWPKERWREALQVWSEDDAIAQRSWHYAADLVSAMPDDVLAEIAHGVSWWLEAVSKSLDRYRHVALDLCGRILTLPLETADAENRGDVRNQPVSDAINHPVGQVTQALLNILFKQEPEDNAQLPGEIEVLFSMICDVRVERFIHGRVLLGANLITLFRVDRSWTEANLLPRFDWVRSSAEATAVWQGFLWSPRLYQPLLLVFKPQFLDTARHYTELGDHGRQFASFLIYAALGPIEGYDDEDFRIALESLPQEGLHDAAQALSQALEGAGDQREEYWLNRVSHLWRNVWPKSLDLATKRIAGLLARLAIAAGAEFPAALASVRDWLQPVEHPDYVVNKLLESGLCISYPMHSLQLLGAIVGDVPWLPQDIKQCLDAIVAAAPELRQDPVYLRIFEQWRRRSGGS